MAKKGRARGRGVVGLIALAVAVAAGVGIGVARRLGTGDAAPAITLDQNPGAVALDTRTGRAFVALQAGRPGTHGRVLILDTGRGSVARTIPLRNPTALAVDDRTGDVVVAARGSLLVLDGRAGTVRRTITTGLSPTALAVDGRARRAVLVTGEGAARDPDPWAWVPGQLRKALPFIPAPSAHFHDVPGRISIIALPR